VQEGVDLVGESQGILGIKGSCPDRETDTGHEKRLEKKKGRHYDKKGSFFHPRPSSIIVPVWKWTKRVEAGKAFSLV
jgi:hypothetical protein